MTAKNIEITKEAQFKAHLIEQIFALALAEDLGSRRIDVTSNATIDIDKISSARLVLKESAIVCGLDIFSEVAKRLNNSGATLEINELVNEGTHIEVPFQAAPVTLATISGNARCLLAAERLSLNLIQRMCGVATITSTYCRIAAPHKIQILDTRKTMPGLRAFDKRAVVAGGGTNHRYGLFDAILIKDNHVRASGSVSAAIERARHYMQSEQAHLPNQTIEVEVTTLDELHEALVTKADRVLLDNMAPSLVRLAIEAVQQSGHHCFIEVSGGINLNNLETYLISGVNAISIGAITHSARNIDLSLEFD